MTGRRRRVGLGHQWVLVVRLIVDTPIRVPRHPVGAARVVESHVAHPRREVELIVPLAPDDSDLDRQAALAVDHNSIITRVQVEAHFPGLPRQEDAAEVRRRARRRRPDDDRHARRGARDLGHVGQVGGMHVGLARQQLVHLRGDPR